jgi:hypothetical protein
VGELRAVPASRSCGRGAAAVAEALVMPERLGSRRLKEILRLHFVSRLSTRQIGASCWLSASTVQS